MAKKQIAGQVRVGISVGDLNGVGMEIILKALEDPRLLSVCTPVVYGSAKGASFYKKAIKSDVFFNMVRKPGQLSHNKPNMVNIDGEIRITPGKASAETGSFAFKSIEAVAKDLGEGHIDAMVTAPIDKKTIQEAGFKFPGHTEYLMKYSQAEDALMFMVSNGLKIGVVSGHVPLKDVAADISKEKIIKKAKLMAQSLQKDFGVVKPKIAVLGLNPHAGDDGAIGLEEKDIIKPAVQEMGGKDFLAFGPYGADGFFGSGQQKHFDGVLAMYHDQGLVPFKALAFDEGVNFTAGLPIVRTSPGHGTAYDLAGKGEASPQSLLSAIYTAVDIFNMRQTMKEWSANPLKKQRISRNDADK